jgi:TANFOR domain-containing protein
MTMRSQYISATVKRCGLLIVSALCLLQSALSQVAPVDITVQLVPPYTSRIVDYVSPGNEKLRIIALQRDLTQASYRFFLRMEVSVNGQVLFRTTRNWQPTPITVAPGTPVILDGAELQSYFDANHLDFVNFNRDQYIANPNLPEGYTSICFTAYDYSRPDVAVSQTNCGNYFLTLPEPPLLNYPACGMQVRALSPQQVIFSWVPMNMGNTAAQNTVYELSLYENRDNRNPNDIVQNIAPVYTSRTNASTVIYGPGEPALQTGMNYVWRVQAVDERGQQAFKNNGFTQPCHFTYTTADSIFNWNNAQPLKIYALAMTEKNAKIGWQPDKDIVYDKYTVYYRKQGNDNNWFNNTLTDTVFFVSNLEPNTTYETRVQGFNGASSGMYSDIVHFTTPEKKVVDCKESAGILAAYNGRPYTKAMHNDIVHYGQFELTLDKIQQLQSGYYSGTGTVTIPFMLGMTLSVSFKSIQIDDAMNVTAGEVIFDSEGIDAWLANTPTVNTVIKNLSDGIKQLLNSTIKGDDKEWKDLAEKVKELAKKELPQALIDSLNSALDIMDNSKIAYKEATQAYNNATTPEAKQEAQNKKDAAEKKYEDAKQTVADVAKKKDELINGVTDVILEAIKKIRQEKDSLIKSVDAFNQEVAAFNKEVKDAQGIDDTDSSGNDILILEDYAGDDDYNDDTRAAFLQKASTLISKKKTIKGAVVYKIFTDFFNKSDSLSTNLIGDKKVNGKQLVDQLIQKQTDNESKENRIAFAYDYLVKALEDYITSLDQK